MKSTSILFATAILAIGLTLCLSACQHKEAEEPEDLTRFTTQTFAGTWCLPDTADSMKVFWYWQLTDTYLWYYQDYGTEKAYYKDWYIYNDAGTDWRIGSFFAVPLEGQYTFDEATQTLYFAGMAMGTVQRIGKDEAILTSNILHSGKCYRIKGFK